MKHRFIFTYLTTCLPTGKQYVGMHCTNNLNDNYLGSGTLLNFAIKKYGRHNFERRVLSWHKNYQTCHRQEKKFIEKYNTLSPNGYNVCPEGGKMPLDCWEASRKKSHHNLGKKSLFKGKTYEEIFGKEKAKEIKYKQSKERKKWYLEHPDACKGENHWMYGKKMTPFMKEQLLKSNLGNKNRLGKKHTEETREKISLKSKGRIPWNKGLKKETDKRVLKYSKSLSKTMKANPDLYSSLIKSSFGNKYRLGKKHTEETKKKISETKKIKKYENTNL